MTSPSAPDSTSTPSPKPVVLPERPSLMWRKLWSAGVLAPGAALPLGLLLRLPPPEVSLLFGMNLVRRYGGWQRQYARASKAARERKGETVPGLTAEEADAIRKQQVEALRSSLKVWKAHYEQGTASVRLADERGYFEFPPPE